MKNKKSNETRNYIAGPDNLQILTYKFRSSLKEWRDEQGETKTVLIDGKDTPILEASYAEILGYFKEYTEQWMLADTKSREDFKHVWFIDCRGLYVTDSRPNLLDAEQNINFLAPVQFDYSAISGNFYLFVRKKFLGEASFFKVSFLDDIHFDEARFCGDVNFEKATFGREVFFSDCEFESQKGASFQQALFSKRVDFSNASFQRAPIFHETNIPQASSFNGAKFNETGKGLSQRAMRQEILALRTLKQLAASYKGQQDEILFFALEQRYTRKLCLALRLVWKKESDKTILQGQQGLNDLFVLDTWHWRSWKYWSIRWNFIEWLISWLYDFVSEYGRNPVRPLYAVVVVNIAAFFIFWLAFVFGDSSDCASSDFCFTKDASMLAQQHPALYLTLQNLISSSVVKTGIIINNIYMLFLGIFQYISTYLILILSALAIKNRFQKGGG